MHRGFTLWRCAAVLVAVAMLGGCDWSLARYDSSLSGYNSTESSINVANVGTLTQHWRGDLHSQPFERSPVVASRRVYIAEQGAKLDVFSAPGTDAGCSGAPRTCQPMWSYVATSDPSNTDSNPSVDNGHVFGTWSTSSGPILAAFDAAGNTNCNGAPKVCAPIWHSAPIPNATALTTPTIAGGVVYVGDFTTGALYAFDAAGNTGCSGAPKLCTPLFTAQTSGEILSEPAVAGGVAYVTTQGDTNNRLKLYAFDAAGSTNCSGAPKACTPLWIADVTTTGQGGQIAAPVVSQGRVFVTTSTTTTTGGLVEAFDAAGSTNCSGSPVACTPLWSAELDGDIFGTAAVANGVLYTGTEGTNPALYAFDATGATNCSGSPVACTPLWSAASGGVDYSSPAVANGVVYIGSIDHHVYGFDASGTTNCSGSPKVCAPLFSGATGDFVISSPVVANGSVFVGSNDGYLHAFSR